MSGRGRSRGFTLLEILLAVLIVASAIVALQAIGNAALRTSVETGKVRIAKTLLRAKAEEIAAGIETGTGGPFEGFPGYSWEVREQMLQAGEQETVRAIEVTVRYPTLREDAAALEIEGQDSPGVMRAAIYLDPPDAKLDPPRASGPGGGSGGPPGGGSGR